MHVLILLHNILCNSGCAGKLFKSYDLPFIVEFILMFYRDKPVDWLLDHLLYVKVCNPEKDNVCSLHFYCVFFTLHCRADL